MPELPVASAYLYRALSFKVKDGDTAAFTLDQGFDNSKATTVRVVGIDTPETRRSKCKLHKQTHSRAVTDREKVVGKRASARLEELLDGALDIIVHSEEVDKYGGRCLGSIYVQLDPSGPWLNAADVLVREHLATRYDGTKATAQCFRDLDAAGYWP